MALPAWLERLRRQEITSVIMNHPTTRNNLVFGLPSDEIYNQVIGRGQADFDAAYGAANSTKSRFCRRHHPIEEILWGYQ